MRQKSGFSLLELSIVLVIIGLIAGGIVAGSSMIRAAELRALTNEFTQYQIAVHTFRDKYLGMPGDLKNAEAFWGTAHATDATCITTASTSKETCNGDGDGVIEYAGVVRSSEIFRFWQHLANAGLINGTYNGVTGSVGIVDHDAGVNAPASKLSGAIWGSRWANNSAGTTAGQWAKDYTRWMSVGGDDGVWADTPFLSTEEVWNLDKKLDDGKPGTGRIDAYPVTGCSDQTSNISFDVAEYDLANKTQKCTVVFNY